MFRPLLLAALMFPSVSSAQSSDGKIGVVRLQDALIQCKEGKTARERLQANFRGKQNQLRNREAALKTRYESLEKRKAAGEGEATLRAELISFQQELMKAEQLRGQLQQELAQQEQKLAQGILKKMKPLIDRIARKDGYTVIIDAATVLYSPKDLDITDKLVLLYDKQNK